MSAADEYDLTAIADVSQLYPKYKSKAEERWSAFGSHHLFVLLGHLTYIQHYEPVTFNLPGGKYTPDWLHILENGQVVIVENKGSKKQKGYPAARIRLIQAATIHFYFTFVEAVVSGDGFICEVVKP